MAIDWDGLVLAPLIGASIFGEDSQPTYTPADGAAFPIDGVFDNGFQADILMPDGMPEFQTVNPVLGVRLFQFASPPLAGDQVTIPSVGQTYWVNEVKADGHGFAKLELTTVEPQL